ncbi:MAG: hypothetical protein KAH77_03845, partial [Thiomargarita sp.]|nr:hypothetical protein [Thiomargarita sp.]
MTHLPQFTRLDYRDLLKQALDANYQFLTFNDPRRFEKDKVCLLRHDIDVDLGAALTLAKIEHQFGIQATYFVMLRSPIYNLLGRANTQLVQDILSLGHVIGLHYDDAFTPSNQHSLEKWVDIEATILEQLFDIKIDVVSFHQPSQHVLSGTIQLQNRLN